MVGASGKLFEVGREEHLQLFTDRSGIRGEHGHRDTEAVRPFHALVHHHREGDGGLVVRVERRGTHDRRGWSAAVQYFDGRHPELHGPIVGVLDDKTMAERLIEGLAAKID